MIDVAYLDTLLATLNKHGVSSFKNAGLELYISSPPGTDNIQAPSPANQEPIIEALKKQEEALPPDLRADDLMNADKVLNWSSPDHRDEQLPLAGEAEL